ncbi:translation initiation factor IF-2-like [Panicum virgatum]|uniref:translation initiation factor IF-2-like n=1 Tax=Panicum virgatum TaxID=38727 RepID=UPI0019D507BE|nr:translation initiation factor IF-2-like [Panicum virgatum]
MASAVVRAVAPASMRRAGPCLDAPCPPRPTPPRSARRGRRCPAVPLPCRALVAIAASRASAEAVAEGAELHAHLRAPRSAQSTSARAALPCPPLPAPLRPTRTAARPRRRFSPVLVAGLVAIAAEGGGAPRSTPTKEPRGLPVLPAVPSHGRASCVRAEGQGRAPRRAAAARR